MRTHSGDVKSAIGGKKTNIVEIKMRGSIPLPLFQPESASDVMAIGIFLPTTQIEE